MSSLCTTAVPPPTIRTIRPRSGHAVGLGRRVRWHRLVSVILVVMVLGWGLGTVALGQAQADSPASAPVIFVVQRGDTLWDLAREHAPSGVSTLEYAYIVAESNDVRPGHLVPGSVLTLPSGP